MSESEPEQEPDPEDWVYSYVLGNREDFINVSMLQYCIIEGYTESCRLLVKPKTPGNFFVSPNSYGKRIPVLMLSIDIGFHNISKILIEAGADVNLQCHYGETPLMYASYRNRIEMCEYLIEKGANVNIQNNDGLTALMLASMKNNYEICQILLRAGSNPYTRDRDKDKASSLVRGLKTKSLLDKYILLVFLQFIFKGSKEDQRKFLSTDLVRYLSTFF